MRFPTHRSMAVRTFLLPMLLAVLASSIFQSLVAARVYTAFDVERQVMGDDTRGPFLLGITGLIAGSDSVHVDEALLVRGRDYVFTSDRAAIELTEPLLRGQKLVLTGKRSLQVFQKVRRREPLSDAPRTILTTLRSERNRRSIPDREDGTGVGQGIDISGVKRLQVAVGTSSEAALTQSLRLEISGQLSEDVRVTGLLTDRSLPLQASGRTRSVQDLDRVHLEVASSTFSAGLGDVDVSLDGTTFGRYRRQLQGARMRMKGSRGDVDLFGAVSEGQWETRRIDTQPGYQGPYTLSSGSRPVAAGSERLYLNGLLLRRGESQDYLIDYDRGLVTFTPTRPVTGGSRVTAEFQTVDPGGRIRSVGLRGQMATRDERARFGTTVIRESKGVVPVSAQAPGQRAAGVTDALLTSVDGAINPVEGLQLEGELAWARSGANELMASGHASQIGMTWASHQARERVSGLAAIHLSGSYRHVGETFQSLDRVDAIANEGAWGWEVDAVSGAGQVGELSARYAPLSFASVGVQVGRRTGALAGHRYGTSLELDTGRHGGVAASFDRIKRTGGELTRLTSSATGSFAWFRPSLRLTSESAEGSAVQSSRLFYARSPVGLPDGARVRELDFRSQIGDGRLALRSSITASRIDQLMTVWADSVEELTHTNQLSWATVSGLQFTGSFGQTARRDRAQGDGTEVVNLGRIRVGYRPSDGMFSQQLQYHVSSTGLSDRDLVYVEVPDGSGTYVWEDVNGDGVQDPEEFVPETGGNFEPIYGLFTSFEPARESSVGLRTHLDFGRGPMRDVLLLKDLAFEISVESERRGRPEDGVGIAPWTHRAFREDSSVLSGRREIRSTVHMFRRNRNGSLRIDSRAMDDMDRRLSEAGRTRVRGWTFVGKLRPVKGWDIEARAETASRERAGESVFAYVTDEKGVEFRNWLRLSRVWQTGLTLGWGRDTEARRDLDVTHVSIGPELRRAFAGRGRFTSRFDWRRVQANDTVPLFLGLADGHRRGQNYRWRLGLDYRLGSYMDAYVTYDGTIRPERPALHVGRMELRATF
jgi:hypothetical protein